MASATYIYMCFFVFLFITPSSVHSIQFRRLSLPSPGPESFVFDVNGEGPYTSISDGRIVKFDRSKVGFVDFGFIAPNRSKALCDGTNDISLGNRCGRPLGLGYYRRKGEIYIADAYYGLCVIGPNGGLAKQLATGAEGVPFKFPDGTDIDQSTGVVYMTDASSVYGLDEADLVLSRRDATGRLIRYDPRTKQVTVLMRGLSGAAGMAVSQDGSFIIVSEYVIQRLQKYWLRGPKANTAEILLNLPGRPNKIVRTKTGDFWVAVTVDRQNTTTLTGYKINGDGIILQAQTFTPQFNTTLITEVHEHRGALYLGSLYSDHVGVQRTFTHF